MHTMTAVDAETLVDSALAFRARCRLAPAAGRRSVNLGARVIITDAYPHDDLPLLYVDVYADPNDPHALTAALVSDGEVLCDIRLRDVPDEVAMAIVASLINHGQKVA